MFNRKFLAFVLCLCAYLNQPARAESHLNGSNICYRIEKSIEPVKVKQVIPVERVNVSGKLAVEYVQSFVWENRTVEKEVQFCCNGYAEIDGACKPHCAIGCNEGDCVGANKCDCLPGFGGEYCNQTCPTGWFGLNCEYSCACLIDPHCNRNFADCSCRPGETPRSECKNICKCRSSSCEAGFHGKNCSLTCPEQTYGVNCIHQCPCKRENTLSCSRTSGLCECKEPFYGIYCENECLGNLRCDTKKRCKCIDGVNTVSDFVNALVLMLRKEKADLESQPDYSWVVVLLLLLMCSLLGCFFWFGAYHFRQAPKNLDVEGMKGEIEKFSQLAAMVAARVMADDEDSDDESRSQRKSNCQSALEEMILNLEKAKHSKVPPNDSPSGSPNQQSDSILAKFCSMFRCFSVKHSAKDAANGTAVSFNPSDNVIIFASESAANDAKETPENAAGSQGN